MGHKGGRGAGIGVRVGGCQWDRLLAAINDGLVRGGNGWAGV